MLDTAQDKIPQPWCSRVRCNLKLRWVIYHKKSSLIAQKSFPSILGRLKSSGLRHLHGLADVSVVPVEFHNPLSGLAIPTRSFEEFAAEHCKSTLQ